MTRKGIELKPGIFITRIWFDDDMIEARVEVSDGKSSFSTEIYIGHQHLKEVVVALDVFNDHVHGGLYELRMGEFGPEYASGAFHARLHFQERGRIFITARTQSDFAEFGRKLVASEATLYLSALPSQLDDFIRALRAISKGYRDDATHEAELRQWA
jgi:hypothetical protein